MAVKTRAELHDLYLESPTYAHYFEYYGKRLPRPVASRVALGHGFTILEALESGEIATTKDGSVDTLDLFMWLGY